VHFYGLLARQLSSVHQRHRKSDGETNWGWPSSEMLQNGQCAATGAGVRAFRVAARIVQVRQERAQRRLAGLPDRAMSGALITPATIRAGQAMRQRPPTRLAPIRPGQQILRDQRPPRRGCPIGINNGRNGGKPCRRSDGRPHRRHRHPRTRDAWQRHHSGGIFARLKGGSKGQKHLQRMLRSRQTRDQRMKRFVVFVSDVEGPQLATVAANN